MIFVNLSCDYCGKKLCEVSSDLYGVVRIKCYRPGCRKLNTKSLSTAGKGVPTEADSAILHPPPPENPSR
jgi:phage FluMu protein Com